MVIIFIIVFAVSSTFAVRYHPGVLKANSDCFPIRNEPSTIVCRSIPQFNTEAVSFFANYKKIVFDLENEYTLSSRTFYNCSFFWSARIHVLFKNLKKISSFAFDSIKIEDNTAVTLQIDGSGLNLDKKKSDSQLLINENAFHNIVVGKKSQFKVEIKNYQSLTIKDNLLQNFAWQNELSEIVLELNDIEFVHYKNRNGKNLDDNLDDYDIDELESSNDLPVLLPKTQIHTLKNNLSYTLQIRNCFGLIFEPFLFSGLLINSFSDFNVILKNMTNLYLSDSMFDSLMLGYYSKFNFIVEKIKYLSLGKSMFSALQTDQYAVFYFHVESVRSGSNITTFDTYDVTETYDGTFYEYDYYYDDYDQDYLPNYIEWLSIPEGFLKNVRMSESSVVQVHFTNIESSLSFSPGSIKEIEMNLDAKFQLMIQDIDGHVIVSQNAFNLIKVMHGLFEFLVDSQRTIVNKNFQPKSVDLTNFKNPIKLLNSVRNWYIRFLDNSINKIFLTSGSNFRFGFLNSNAIVLLDSKSMTDIHVDRFDESKNNLDYRTKLELDIEQSDHFMMDFSSLNFVDPQYLSIAKLIEIDGYKPLIHLIKSNHTFETIFPEYVRKDKNFKMSTERSDLAITQEFCRFYKLRPYMVSLSSIHSNLVYFSHTSISDRFPLSHSESCTSCLLMYLYRTVHRRVDFYFVKDHLPKCFVNLHFGNESRMELLSSRDEQSKNGYVTTIEEGFRNYWKMLDCKYLTGLGLILNYDKVSTPGDESKENYELISNKCARSDQTNVREIELIQKLDSKAWSEISNRIYLRNTMDTKSNRSQKIEITSYKKKTKAKKSNSGFTISSWLILFLVLGSCIGLAILYMSYNKPKKPCLRLRFYRGNNFQRLEYNRNAKNSSMTNMECEDEAEENNDELNGFEYDDEFELNENQLEDNLDCDSNENVDIKVIDASNSSALGNFKTRSLDQIKRLKNNLLNKDKLKTGLLNVTNLNHSHFKKPSRNSKFPSYTYKSTDSTLINNQSGFEAIDEDFKVNSVVTYDVKNQKSTPVIGKSLNLSDNQLVEEPVMRLSTNPLDNVEILDNKIKNQRINLDNAQSQDCSESIA
ncbi:hypothetical protein BpHYR1_012426 [Brachionus plicatilis]|uniref:Uncharacterized protein n=1 Tax=Brachionus plicatilis TaxID=10195 RepID=A0A3M7SNZ2_BRAPC|nr:hypothetical protein BpHYR1_012426 [Brachionus plicatilis]